MSFHDEGFHDINEASHHASAMSSHDEASHDINEASRHASPAPSHDEASHDVDEVFQHASVASFLYDPDSHRRSVMQLTGVPDDSEVGRLVRGDKKEV